MGTGEAAPVRTSAANQDLVSHQASLREALGDYFYSWKESGSATLFWSILTASFLYGILHALGPGHRKTIIFSLYLARKAPVWEPAGTGFLLSTLHAGSAIILLLLLRGVTGALSGKADTIAVYMEGFAYVLLIVIATYLIVHAIRDLLQDTGQSNSSMGIGTIFLTGLYPCPAAILILILSFTLQITGIGILAVFAMSLGMSLPIIAAGYLAWFGRTSIFFALKSNQKIVGRISTSIQMLSYMFLLGFAVYMAAPFIVSLLK
ncbi:membrane protein [Treponema sp.]